MTHFAEQNGPFCDVKRPILEIGSVFLSDLYGFFTILEVVGLLELKIQKGLFFGKESGQSGVCQAPLRFLPIRRLLPSRLSAVQSVMNQTFSDAVTGKSSLNPTPVTIYSAPAPCGCPGCGCGQ